MPMLPAYSAIDAVTLNDGAGAYEMVTPVGSAAEYSLAPSFATRPEDTPIFQGWSGDARRVTFLVRPGPGAAGTSAWAADVMEVFNPNLGIRTLRGQWEGETVEARILIVSFGPATIGLFEGVYVLLDPFWRAITAVSGVTTSPITPGGNVAALPTVTVTPTGTDHRLRAVTITNPLPYDLGNFPVVVGGGTIDGINHGTIDTSGMGATAESNYLVIAPDLTSIPFFVLTPNHATATRFFFRVDIPASSSVTVLLLWGANVSNALLAANFDTAGWDVGHANIGNHKWIWRSTPTTIGSKVIGAMFQLSKNPRVTGAWFLTRMGELRPQTSFRFRQTATQSFFDFQDTQGFINDADGVGLVTQVPLGTTNALTNLTTTLSGSAPPSLRLKFLPHGEVAWQDMGGTSMSGDADLATQLAVYGEPSASAGIGVLEVSGTPQVVFNTASFPTVSVGAAVTMRRLNGLITNTLTGDAISFTDVWVDSAHAVVLTFLDPRSIAVSSGGTLIGEPKPISRTGAFRLVPNVPNTWTNTLAATVSFAYLRRFAA